MSRPETGPMKFADDWTGVFIRGDNALMAYAPALLGAIQILEQEEALSFYDVVRLHALRGLYETLVSAQEGMVDGVQFLRSFQECKR